MPEILKVGVVTVGRSDYGTCRRLLKELGRSRRCDPWLYVSGAHFSEASGNTFSEIEQDGFKVRAKVPMDAVSDRPEAIAEAIGEGTVGFARVFEKELPDVLVVIGDRSELLGVVTAALPFRIPVAHLSGGEISEGATDDMVRHAVTKMSHLHFPTNEEHAARIRQLGESSDRVFPVGDPALDRLKEPPAMTRDELESSLGISLLSPVIVVTHHPVTQGDESYREIDELVEAMKSIEATWIITFPNADRGSQGIVDRFREFQQKAGNAVFVPSLGQERYYSLLGEADAMLGNSSSGIWESASFELPVVNVGDRQNGRLKARNVIDCEASSASIRASLQQTLDPAFRESLVGLVNPYGDGQAARRIVGVLEGLEVNEALKKKLFVDLPS